MNNNWQVVRSMDDISGTDMVRLSGLYAALAPVVVELDARDTITYVVGNPSEILGAEHGSVVGKRFVDFIHDKDEAIWKLIRHKISKVRHLGPLPMRLKDISGRRRAFELHVARGAVGSGTLLLSLSPYSGHLSLGENRRPASSLDRKFEKDDFETLARRLEKFIGESDKSVAEALVGLAGLGVGADQDAQTSLWALYSLLHDSASEGAATRTASKNRPLHDRKKRDVTQVSAPENVLEVASAVREAYRKNLHETNYVTVAGEDGISEAEAVKAAVYAMKQAANAGQAKTMKALTGGYEKRLDAVKNQLRTFKKIVLQERFDIALQPIVNIGDGSTHHFEALTRFDKNIFAGSPFEFMCFAEDVGVIQEFDLAMIMKVISLLKRTRRLGYNTGMAVNISGRSIQSQGFLRHFFRLLEDCSDIKDLLSFELTESSQIEDLETTNRVLSRIRDFGHKVALDDFGAGASGLQYLRVLKVDVVKIDGIYIRKGIEEKENRSFLRSMVELCSGLGIKTIGECVECESQRAFLEEIGVDYAQGWLYGKPLPVDVALRGMGAD